MKRSKFSKSIKIILAILLIGLAYSVFQYHSNHEKNVITEQILNETNIISGYNIVEAEDNIEFDSEYLKSFSLIDKPSVYVQLLFSNFKELVNYKSRNKFKNLNNKNQKTTFYYSVSEPILSSNSDLALIKITEHCEMLCGESSVYIFEKVNGKWKIKKKILIWIS
ncbi:hypothetical protein [Empedobacter tilapiae]|uniref:Uncharacterized protein n=1 Tax=Empedobacter tilapiae TaxID=2491114 RepID=A0A4Z1B2Y9_9FLAO|nr:hypothetical protein [Empedobacter tilapiae]TGN27863.1 hypothetical protein E4J94_06525 [Empedobacter tilapiae]